MVDYVENSTLCRCEALFKDFGNYVPPDLYSNECVVICVLCTVPVRTDCHFIFVAIYIYNETNPTRNCYSVLWCIRYMLNDPFTEILVISPTELTWLHVRKVVMCIRPGISSSTFFCSNSVTIMSRSFWLEGTECWPRIVLVRKLFHHNFQERTLRHQYTSQYVLLLWVFC